MALHSATPRWSAARLLQKWSKQVSISSDRHAPDTTLSVHDAQSPERLERIAAYARSGYFNTEYTAGMFVVPFDIPSE